MKEIFRLKPRVLLSFVIILFGLSVAMIPEDTTQQYKLTAKQMLEEVQYGSELIHPDELADWLINKDPSIQLIDVRSPEEYEKFSLGNAINIPLSDILSDEWVDYLDQGVKMNILYCNGSTSSNEAWMILRQLGYDNNYVLQGGLNYWVETILNPESPKSTDPNDAIAKYDFRKGASQYFGGAAVSSASSASSSTTKKPVIKRKTKKKAPEGGC
jgi:sulfur-carrier protein adenylyltransferase/sulfurtransferase